MTWDRCKKCGRHGSEYHQCAPGWLALDPEYHGDNWDDAILVYAYNADDAAEEAAEHLDDGGDGPSARIIRIKLADGNGEEHTFSITFDYSVNYYARKIEANESR